MTGNLTAGLPPVLDEANPSISLGASYVTPDGFRKFRYVKAGSSALTAGLTVQAPAEDTADQNIAATAAAVGDTSITTAAMTVTANQYAGGFVVVTVTPGLANTYKIKSHAAYTAAAATFVLESPILVALTTSSRLDFIPNPYNGVIATPTTRSSSVVGVAVNDITASQYGWVQTWGPCPVTNDAAGALTVGVTVMPSSSVTGAVRLATAGNPVVGQAMTGIASGETGMIDLCIS